MEENKVLEVRMTDDYATDTFYDGAKFFADKVLPWLGDIDEVVFIQDTEQLRLHFLLGLFFSLVSECAVRHTLGTLSIGFDNREISRLFSRVMDILKDPDVFDVREKDNGFIYYAD